MIYFLVLQEKLLSQPLKKIVFEDYNQYFIKNVGSQNSFNELLSSGIAGAKSILVIPYFTASANSSTNPLSPMLSPCVRRYSEVYTTSHPCNIINIYTEHC